MRGEERMRMRRWDGAAAVCVDLRRRGGNIEGLTGLNVEGKSGCGWTSSKIRGGLLFCSRCPRVYKRESRERRDLGN